MSGFQVGSSRRNDLCRQKECKQKAYAKGLCAKHYRAARDTIVGTRKVPKNRRLTEDQKREIKRMNAAFATKQEIAEKMGISRVLVRKVLSS